MADPGVAPGQRIPVETEEDDMDEGGPFLRRPNKGRTRIWGLSACEDCGFEARGEISVAEEDGVMRRRCDCCGQARYPGLVEDWEANRLTWLPEIEQAAAGHLVRSAHMLLHVTEREGRGSPGVERSRAGAWKIRTFIARRQALVWRALKLPAASNPGPGLQRIGADALKLAREGFRLLPVSLPEARLDAWAEAGTFHGLGIADIERMGTEHGTR